MDNNLRCTVSSCYHHKDSHCCLDTIQVTKTAPEDSVNTVCSSYMRSGTNMSANENTAKNSLDINCNARNCKFNMENICSATNVTIALNHNNAECVNFKPL